MTEVVTFLDSFDHLPPAWVGAKYTGAAAIAPEGAGSGGVYDLVPGPYLGSAARFSGTDRRLSPAQRNAAHPLTGGTNPFWDSGAWSANVRLGTTGWAGELCLLAPAYYNQEDVLVDFPHHWLTVDAAGTVRVYSWAAQPADYPETQLLAASAPGVWPLGVWVGVEYRTQIRGDNTSAGTCALRLNETLVLDAGALVTIDPQRAVIRARYFRFGNMGALPGTPAGWPEALFANAVDVDVDDVCERAEPGFEADPVAWRGTHRIAVSVPVGPGDLAELVVVGQPPGANWLACADLPAGDDPDSADADPSYVEKVPDTLTPEENFPRDRLAMAPLPEFQEGAAGAAALFWGVARHTAGGVLPDPGPAVQACVTWVDRTGGTIARRFDIGREYRAYCHTEPPDDVLTLTNHPLEDFQFGFGANAPLGALEQQYWGTHLAVELWHKPGGAAPAGRARAQALWWP